MPRLNLLVLLVLISQLLPPVSAASAQETAPPLVATPCYSGANPPTPEAICLAVPVLRKLGVPAVGVNVEVLFNGKQISAQAIQTVDQPYGAAVAALDLSQLSATPGKTVRVRVRANGKTYERYVAVDPDKQTLTQYTEPILLETIRDIGPRPIWGTVSLLDDRRPLEGIPVTLYYNGKEPVTVKTQVVSTYGTTPTFAFDPKGIPANTPLRLEAVVEGKRHSVQFTWPGSEIEVPIVIGWDCIDDIPRRKGGLTDSFCLSGTALIDGEPAANVSVSVTVGDQTLTTVTTATESSPTPMFRFELSELINGRELTEIARIAIAHNGYIGEMELPLGPGLNGNGLDVAKRWGKSLSISLRGERSGAIGLQGGITGPVAVSTSKLGRRIYAGVRGGIVVWSEQTGTRFRSLGSSPDADLPTPEVVTLALLGTYNGEDVLIAGTESREVALSTTSGRTWTRITGLSGAMQNDPLTAVAVVPRYKTMDLVTPHQFYLAWPDRLLPVRFINGTLVANGPEQVLPFIITALTAWNDNRLITAFTTWNDGRLFAGSSNGLWLSEDGGISWNKLPQVSEPITALATTRPFMGPLLFVGTEKGLFRCDAQCSLESWIAAGITQPINGLGAPLVYPGSNYETTDNQRLAVSTPQGIILIYPKSLDSISGSYNETLLNPYTVVPGEVAVSETVLMPKASVDGKLTVGTPDVFDIVSWPDNEKFLAAATSTGIYTSANGGLNWSLLPPLPNRAPLRAVAPLPNGGLLALSVSNLYAWANGAWQDWTNRLPLPSGQPLNASTIRFDGQNTLLLGRSAPGDNLLLSTDKGENWQSLPVGDNIGVNAIVFPQQPLPGGVRALIASDGLFAWTPDAPTPVTSLGFPQSNAPIIGIAVTGAVGPVNACRVIVGTMDAPGQIGKAPCDQLGNPDAWRLQALPVPGGGIDASTNSQELVGAIQAIDETSDGKVFVATSDGIFTTSRNDLLDVGTDTWSLFFGIPLRPQTMLVPPSYSKDRLLLVGGEQSGIVLLNDYSPDLLVTLDAPEEVLGGQVMTYTVTVKNLGLLAAVPGTVSLKLPPILDEAAGAVLKEHTFTEKLRSGDSISFNTVITVPNTIKPQTVRATASVGNAPEERFVANNQASIITQLRYRDAPDATLIIGGDLRVQQDKKAQLQINVGNIGTQQTDSGTLTLEIPAGLSIKSWQAEPDVKELPPTGISRNWSFPPLKPAEWRQLTLEYVYDGSVPLPLRVKGQVSTSDDREPDNNIYEVTIDLPQKEPQVLVVTNFTRLARLGPVGEVRARLEAYLTHQSARGVELALDTNPNCAKEDTFNQLYQNFDTSVAALAKADPTKEQKTLIGKAIDARTNLSDEIADCIDEMIDGPPSIRSIYIIGGDAVVPYAVSEKEKFAEAPLSEQALRPQSVHAPSIPLADTLYAVFAADRYLTQRPYGPPLRSKMPNNYQHRMPVARQEGDPSTIKAALELYLARNGAIDLFSGLTAGTAWDLTEDVQRQICRSLRNKGYIAPTIDCNNIGTGILEVLDKLKAGRAINSISGHADQTHIGDLSSEVLAEVLSDPNLPARAKANLILMLGCHTGLVPDPTFAKEPALVTALANAGQPAFGYSAYAYASDQVVRGASLAYAERLQDKLVTVLLKGQSPTLGDLLGDALLDYATPSTMDVLSQKTVDTLTLFGPPTYQLKLLNPPSGSPMTVTKQSDTPKQSLQLGVSYTPQTSADGTVFEAALNPVPGASIDYRTFVGRTVQPAATLELPPDAHGVFFVDGAAQDIANIDPRVPRVAPLGTEPQPYSEPPYQGPRRDWIMPAVVGWDSSDLPVAQVALGQWTPGADRRVGVQRLFTALTLNILSSADTRDRKPPTIPDDKVVSCYLNRKQTRVEVTVRAPDDAVRLEVVLIQNGQLKALPMSQVKKGTWKVQFPYAKDAQYFVQAADAAGNVTFVINRGKLYPMPDRD